MFMALEKVEKLKPVFNIQLLVYAAYVIFDCVRGYEETLTYIFIVISNNKKMKDLFFSGSQLIPLTERRKELLIFSRNKIRFSS